MVRKEDSLVLGVRLERYELFDIAELNLNNAVVIRHVGELGVKYLAHQSAGRERIVCLFEAMC